MKTIENVILDKVLRKEGFNKVRELSLKDGYTTDQVDIALKYITKRNLNIEIKDNDLFDIKDISTNKYLNTNIDFAMIIERGYDCLRDKLEYGLRKDSISSAMAQKLLEDLNGMFENIQYIIKYDGEKRYLSLKI